MPVKKEEEPSVGRKPSVSRRLSFEQFENLIAIGLDHDDPIRIHIHLYMIHAVFFALSIGLIEHQRARNTSALAIFTLPWQ